MIIALAGPIGSGKSSLSRALASRLNAKLLAFGEYVRARARNQGSDSASRSALQDLGQRLASNPAAFVEEALLWSGYKTGEHYIVDGIRHEAIWREITNIGRRTNEEAWLIFLEVSEQERRRRLRARGLEIEAIATYDNHPSEQEVRRYLYDAADLRLNGEQAVGELVETVIRSLVTK